jgi:recombination protein RecR
MIKYPDNLQKLIDSFKKYPGIGPKNAERLAFYTIMNLKQEDAISFSENILNSINAIKKCDICGMITEDDICDICKDIDRENKLMIVEGVKDVMAFEKTNFYKGRYHVLKGVISPLNGVGAEDLKLDALIERIKKENIKEIILSTSSSLDGEMTAMYIKKLLEKEDVNVYRIGYGLPVGADIEYADDITLMRALESKKEM